MKNLGYIVIAVFIGIAMVFIIVLGIDRTHAQNRYKRVNSGSVIKFT